MIFFSRVDLIGAGDDWFIQGKCLQLEQRKYSRDFIFWNIIIHVNLRPVSKGILTKFRKLSGKYHWWESLLEKLLVTGLQLFRYRLRAEILHELSIFFFKIVILLSAWERLFLAFTSRPELEFTCWRSTMKTPEQCLKFVQN